MRKGKIFFIITGISLLSMGCVSYSVPPQVFVLNLYNSPVYVRLGNETGKICSFDNVVSGSSKPFITLPESGMYSVSWKTNSMASWQVRQKDSIFPDLITGKYLFQPGLKYLLVVDRHGIIRIITLKEKSGYGARICLFNASSFDISWFNLYGEESIANPYLEIKQIPPDATTHFLTIVPGKVVPVISPDPEKTGIAPGAGPGFSEYIPMQDNSYYFFLIRNKGNGFVIDHYLLSENDSIQ